MNDSITPHNCWLHPKAEKFYLRREHTEVWSRGVTIYLFSRCICVVRICNWCINLQTSNLYHWFRSWLWLWRCHVSLMHTPSSKAVAPHCNTQVSGDGVRFRSEGWSWVGLGVGLGIRGGSCIWIQLLPKDFMFCSENWEPSQVKSSPWNYKVLSAFWTVLRYWASKFLYSIGKCVWGTSLF